MVHALENIERRHIYNASFFNYINLFNMKKVRFLIGVKFPVLGRDITMSYENSYNEHTPTQTILDDINVYVTKKIEENYFRPKWEYLFISQVVI